MRKTDLFGIKLSDEEQRDLIEAFRDLYESEMGESIGLFQAETMVTFFIEKLGPSAYNLALDHVRAWYRQKQEDMDLEYDMLYRENRIR